MVLVKQFYKQHGKTLSLELLAGESGLKKRIKKAELQRPGLSLAGYMKGFTPACILVIGRQEIEYLKELESATRGQRLASILSRTTVAIILSKGCTPPKELLILAEEHQIALFKTDLTAPEFISRTTIVLREELASNTTLHGTLVEVFGVGVLIQGESSVGKSEAALGLIERGHRLISDDVVRVRKREGVSLIGRGPELTRHLMEIRGIGIINVAHLYGAVCVRPDKGIEVVVKLEEWNDQHFYDRVGLDEKFIDILEVKVPYHTMPVKPGRDVVLLLETIALNHRLKDMGYHSAKEFNIRLLAKIAKDSSRREKFAKRVVHEACV
jgi:HPr kinase/phosphorylase